MIEGQELIFGALESPVSLGVKYEKFEILQLEYSNI